MPKSEQRLSHDEAEEEAFEIQKNLEKNQKPSEGGGFSKEQYQVEAEKIQAEKEIKSEKIELTAEQEKGKQSMISFLSSRYETDAKNALRSKKEYNIPEAVAVEIAKEAMIKRLLQGDISYALDIKEKFHIPDEFINSPEVQQVAEKQIIDILSSMNMNHTDRWIKEKFNIPDEFMSSPEVQRAAQEGMIKRLSDGWINGALKNIEEFHIPDEFMSSPEVQRAAQEGMICNLKKESGFDDIRDAIAIKEKFNLPEAVAIEAAKIAVIDILQGGNIDLVGTITENFGMSIETEYYIDALKPFQVGLVNLFKPKLDTIYDFSMIMQGDFYQYISRTPETPVVLEKKDLDLSDKLHITYKEAEELKRQGVNLELLTQTNNFEALAEKLFVYSEDWKDQQNIVDPFKAGKTAFGAEKMFSYLNRDEVSRHDGLHAFRQIISLCQSSGLSPDQFYGQILAQVNSDGATYESGTSCHELNSIAQSINLDIKNTLAKASQYSEVEMLQVLAASMDSPQAVFASWNNLKRFAKLTNLLERTEILDQLKELKKLGKPELYHYIETLAFHPSSKVEMQSVLDFWREPEKFLAEDDDHTPTEVHDRKKPSNYVEIPNLDLTAEELRDALVEGKMDGLQALNPMEITYTIPLEGKGEEFSLKQRMIKALGSRSEGVKGQAKDAKKLFNEINKILKPSGVSVKDYLAGQDISEETENHILELLDDETIGLPDESQLTFIAKINEKSDPNGVLAGNDTSCCMPFGSGKNTVYTFNPDTSLFTLQIKRPDGNLRTIAQSVLTKDKDVKRLIPEILAEFKRTPSAKMNEVVPETILTEEQNYLAADNVEVAPNFKEREYEAIIERIYRDFFAEYMKRFAKQQNLHSEKIIIGQGYSDTLTHLPEEKNTFVPLAPVGYSDKSGESIYVLDLTKEAPKLKRKVKIEKVAERKETPLPEIKGISYLTFQDSLAVSYLEGKAYSDNESLITYLHNMENGLIAKDINNAAKGRQNMSLKYVDAKGKMRGYILAYEGRLGAGEGGEEDYYEERRISGESVIYISDFASDKGSPVSAGAILKGFAELYQKNYLKKNNLVPIYAEAREQTSYRIIQKNIQALAEDLGIEVEVEELPTYQSGEDTMHPVIIRPKKVA